LREQLDAMRHPQQPPQLDPMDHWILQTYPGLSESMFHYLRQRPQLAAQPQLAHAAHAFAQHHGNQPDSPEYFNFIDSLIRHQMPTPGQHDAPMSAPETAPPSAPPPNPAGPPVAHIDVERTAGPEPESAMAAHVAAPPSRGYVPGFEPEESPNTVRLSPAEREHARASGVSEMEYAKQKLRMNKAKRDGLIKD
jgi:hypothetical protein